MIEIKGERELIQIDVTQFNSNKKYWESGDSINCNIYFQKLECKFVSRNIVISYDTLKFFIFELKQIIKSHEGGCSLSDENRVIFLGYEIDRRPNRSALVIEDNIYKVEFDLFFHKGSDISLSGYLFSNKDSLKQTIKEIEYLL